MGKLQSLSYSEKETLAKLITTNGKGLMEAGKRRLSGDTMREANTSEV